jgi:hypothetical protein
MQVVLIKRGGIYFSLSVELSLQVSEGHTVGRIYKMSKAAPKKVGGTSAFCI